MADELKIAQQAIEIGLISKSQLDECLKIQRDISSLGIEEKSLKDIFISKNYMSEDNWLQIYNDLEDLGFDTSHKTIKMSHQNNLEGKDTPTIDGYDIVDEIGKGAMGSVYRGVQVSMERAVAIKVLDKKLSKDKNLVDRFTLEARTTARLSHENIISGIDAGITKDGIRYFVMEFVQGNSLGEILEQQQRIDPVEAANILLKVSDALCYAHQEGIIHRDIKPDNIIITDENVPKLCDLGLVRDFADNSRLTMEGHALGTPHYISPEQARGLRDSIDNRSDIYSLGATFYHMVTGSPPFPQKNPAVVCAMHATKPFPHPHSIDGNIPKAICKIIDKCTQKKPNKRYQDCEQIVNDLRNFLDNHSPFQDDDQDGGEYENDDNDYVEDEAEAPLSFADENTVRPRRRRSSRRAEALQVQTSQAEYSTSSVVVAILSALIILVGGAYYVYEQFKKSDSPSEIVSVDNNENNKDDISSLKNQIVERINRDINFDLINFDSKDNVEEEINKYRKIREEYEDKRDSNKQIDENFTKITNWIDREKQKLTELLERKGEEEYNGIVAESIKQAKTILRRNNKVQQDLRNLKKAYDELAKFPVGLHFTVKGTEVQRELSNVEISLQENLRKKEEIADELRAKRNYKEARDKYNEIMEFALSEDIDYIQSKKDILQKEYLEHQQKVFAKIKNEFRNGIDKPLIQGKYENALAHLKKYQNKPYLDEIIEYEQEKLRNYIEIKEQLSKSNSLEQRLKDDSAENMIDEMGLSVTTPSKWAMGIAYINYGLLEKAYDILNNQKNNEVLLSYLDINIKNNNAKKLFSEIQKSIKKNTKVAFSKALQLKKYSNTKFYEDNASKIRKLSNQVYKLYLQKYAVELYFKRSFTNINHDKNTFKIEYSLESLEDIEDFFGTKDRKLCSIDEYQLTSHASQPEDIFEIYWKGKIKGNLDLQVTAILNKKSYNVGLAFFKKDSNLKDLDKHLVLANYSPHHFVLHEIYNKDSGSKYLPDINKIPKEQNKCILGYVDGQVSFLRRKPKYEGIPLSTKYLEIIGENKTRFKVKVRNNQIRSNIDNKKLSSEVKNINGYVGLYSNSRARFLSFKIEGTFDEVWINEIKKEILENPTKYLQLAEKRETR